MIEPSTIQLEDNHENENENENEDLEMAEVIVDP